MKGLSINHATMITPKRSYPAGKDHDFKKGKDGKATVKEAAEIEDLHAGSIVTVMNRENVDLERAVKILKFEPAKKRKKYKKVDIILGKRVEPYRGSV